MAAAVGTTATVRARVSSYYAAAAGRFRAAVLPRTVAAAFTLTDSEKSDQLRDGREVVVVVLGDEVGEVYDS